MGQPQRANKMNIVEGAQPRVSATFSAWLESSARARLRYLIFFQARPQKVMTYEVYTSTLYVQPLMSSANKRGRDPLTFFA